MKKERPAPQPGTLSLTQRILTLIWLPIHLLVLPVALMLLLPAMDELEINLIYYAVSCAVLVAINFTALRRDFDPLCDKFGENLRIIAICYGLVLLGNLVTSLLIGAFTDSQNLNNSAVEELLEDGWGPMAGAVIFLAPIAEELLFRGGVFGAIRQKNRHLAYVVSVLLFAGIHVLSFALTDPGQIIFVLQYLPAAFLLAWCYEKTGSIWCSILLHMLNNGVSVWLMGMGG